MVAEVHPDEAADRPDSGGQHQHAGEGVGQHPGDGGGDDQRGGDQGHAQHPHGGQDRGCQHQHEQSVDARRAHARHVGHLGVEGGEQQSPVAEEHHGAGEHRHRRHRPHVAGGHPEDAAEQGGVEAPARPAEHGEQRQAQREAGRGDDADGGIGPDHPPAGDAVDHERRGHSPGTGTEEEVDAEQGAGGEAAEDGVGEAMADVAHPLQHHVHPHQAAQAAGEGGHGQPVAEELELERSEELVDHWARRRLMTLSIS